MTFQLEPYTVGEGALKAQLAVELGQLFEFYDVQSEHIGHLKFIKNCKQYLWPPSPPFFNFNSESGVMLEICSRILKPLCRADEVILEKRYRT